MNDAQTLLSVSYSLYLKGTFTPPLPRAAKGKGGSCPSSPPWVSGIVLNTLNRTKQVFPRKCEMKDVIFHFWAVWWVNDGLLRCYCDGDHFKTRHLFSLFSLKPAALQIVFHYEALQTCKVYQSEANKHKIVWYHCCATDLMNNYWFCYIYTPTVGINLLVIHLGAFYYILGSIRPL